MLYLHLPFEENPWAFSPNLFRMLNKAIMYAKLAWVYAKGMCGFRRRVYDLQFVYVPEDKNWYIDIPWPGDRYNLAMVAGSNHLLKLLDYKGERRVRVMVKPSSKSRPELLDKGYFECDKQFSRLLDGATYKVNGLDEFTREMWICPVTLTVLGHYPQYIYIKQVNIDGSAINPDVRKNYVKLMQTKFVDINITTRFMNVMEKLNIVTFKDLMYAVEDDVLKEYPLKAREELYELIETLDLPWGTKEKREESMNKAAGIDRMWCVALTYSILQDEMKEWKKVGMDYKEHPDRYEDLTEYDEEGRPCVKSRNITYVMPDMNYDNFLEEMTCDDGKYSDLTLFDDIYMLLDCRKFVKPISSSE